ncbi:MAG TPA: MarR family transcriptional regulator [Steroidobacteraceae bacterium]|nr:MarR family transcriptional regulator [Steroidobacteraceae bacterium]
MNLPASQLELLEASVKRLSVRLPETPELCILIVRVLQQVARELGEMLEQRLRPFGVSEGEFRVLVTLYSQPECIGHPSELCARTAQRPANMSRICDALVTRGLITRISSCDDRRRMVLRITPRGEELVGQLLPTLFSSLGRLFEGLPELERRRLLDLLKHVGKQLETTATATAQHGPQ